MWEKELLKGEADSELCTLLLVALPMFPHWNGKSVAVATMVTSRV